MARFGPSFLFLDEEAEEAGVEVEVLKWKWRGFGWWIGWRGLDWRWMGGEVERLIGGGVVSYHERLDRRGEVLFYLYCWSRFRVPEAAEMVVTEGW